MGIVGEFIDDCITIISLRESKLFKQITSAWDLFDGWVITKISYHKLNKKKKGWIPGMNFGWYFSKCFVFFESASRKILAFFN